MSGIELIAAERQRQIDVEGWTPEHDDQHQDQDLVDAGTAYIDYGGNPRFPPGHPPMRWPWDAKWWKPSHDPIRNRAKGCALIAASIDRLHRAAAPAKEG